MKKEKFSRTKLAQYRGRSRHQRITHSQRGEKRSSTSTSTRQRNGGQCVSASASEVDVFFHGKSPLTLLNATTPSPTIPLQPRQLLLFPYLLPLPRAFFILIIIIIIFELAGFLVLASVIYFYYLKLSVFIFLILGTGSKHVSMQLSRTLTGLTNLLFNRRYTPQYSLSQQNMISNFSINIYFLLL